MLNNPLQLIQMFQQIRSNTNPLGAMQQIFGNNPLFSRALEMSNGKSPEEMEQTVKNLCSQRGIDFNQAKQMISQMGIKL